MFPKSFLIFVICCFPLGELLAQKMTVENSTVTFFSDAPLEEITAENKKCSGLFNLATREIVFSVPIKEFQFEKSLMKEHFTEKYMESEKFPKSTFQGTISIFNKNLSGSQEVKATGKLTIHGVTKEVELPGTLEFRNGNVIINSKFIVKLADYKITIPQLLWQNIAEQVEVTTRFVFKPQ